MTTQDADMWLAWGLKRVAVGVTVVAAVLVMMWAVAWLAVVALSTHEQSVPVAQQDPAAILKAIRQ